MPWGNELLNSADGHAAAGSGSEGTCVTTVLIVDDHRSFADLLSARRSPVDVSDPGLSRPKTTIDSVTGSP